jgi:hypothetical protein
LKINENKTKYMIATGADLMIRDVGQSVAFGDKTFEHLSGLNGLNNFFLGGLG